MTEARPVPDLCRCGEPELGARGCPYCNVPVHGPLGRCRATHWHHEYTTASPALPEPPLCACGHAEFYANGEPIHVCECEGPHDEATAGDDYCAECRETMARTNENAYHVFAPALPVEGDDSDRPTDTEIENAWHAAYYAWRTAQGYGNRLHSWHAGELAFAAGYRQARADERRASDELQRQADRTFTGYEQALARALASEERERGLRQAAIAVVATFDVLDARGVTLAQEGTVLGDSLSALRRALLIPENADEGKEG